MTLWGASGFTMRAGSCGKAYPRSPAGVRTLPASLPATGRGWAHSPFSRGSGRRLKESEWLEIQEA